MHPLLSWWLLIPFFLSIAYGYTESRAKPAMHLSVRRMQTSWFFTSLCMACLALSWSILGYALPIFYLLIYFFQAFRLLLGQPICMKNWFLLNLSYANSLALHLVLIGLAALIQDTSMYALLDQSFWRIMSLSAVLFTNLIEDIYFLLRPKFSNLLTAEAESEEARPFMAFLWFSSAYLLVDSLLCVFHLEPLYPPLFLIGSSLIVIFTLIRFLLHINTLMQNNHLKEEHDRLSSQLEATEESAGLLKQLAERDILTGVLSRRCAMEQVESMIADRSPFALVFLDLDALKQVNDTQGHDAGDAHLIGFTQALAPLLRDCDLLARVGGDEFVVLMPGCSAAAARNRIEEIRKGVEAQETQGAPIRFSYGVTAFPEGEQEGELLICEADKAMYQDKMRRHGKEGCR